MSSTKKDISALDNVGAFGAVHVNMKHASEIYGLWETVGHMARDLGEAPSDLISRRANGEIPDPMHDQTILSRALDQDVYLRQSHLAEMRRRYERRGSEGYRRRAIGELFDEVGGATNMARRIGATPNAMRLAKHRARLPERWKLELKQTADELGHKLDMSLFDPI